MRVIADTEYSNITDSAIFRADIQKPTHTHTHTDRERKLIKIQIHACLEAETWCDVYQSSNVMCMLLKIYTYIKERCAVEEKKNNQYLSQSHFMWCDEYMKKRKIAMPS